MVRQCLIVDDDPDCRLICEKIVSTLGYETVTACDGDEALLMCSYDMPEVILLDWSMPNMDGIKFMDKLKKFMNSNQAMVIMCTGKNERTHIQHALSSGAKGYVIKPFDRQSLVRQFRHLNLY